MAKFLFLNGTDSVVALNLDQITTFQYEVGGSFDDGMVTLSSGQTVMVDTATRNAIDEILQRDAIQRPASATVTPTAASHNK